MSQPIKTILSLFGSCSCLHKVSHVTQQSEKGTDSEEGNRKWELGLQAHIFLVYAVLCGITTCNSKSWTTIKTTTNKIKYKGKGREWRCFATSGRIVLTDTDSIPCGEICTVLFFWQYKKCQDCSTHELHFTFSSFLNYSEAKRKKPTYHKATWQKQELFLNSYHYFFDK